MGMPAALDRKWTADEVLALPESPGQRYEVVDGELFVSPGPRFAHQRAVYGLLSRMHEYVARMPRIGELMFGPGEARLDDHTLVQPDVFVAPLMGGRRPDSLDDCTRFRLVVEVLSPSSHRADRVEKRRRYQRSADEYWIVDADARLIERWRPDDERPEILTETVVWHPAGRDEPLTIDLPALFREAFAEET